MSFLDETQDEDRHEPGPDALRQVRMVCCATHDLELQEPPEDELRPRSESNFGSSGPELGGPQKPTAAGFSITHDLECTDRDMV